MLGAVVVGVAGLLYWSGVMGVDWWEVVCGYWWLCMPVLGAAGVVLVMAMEREEGLGEVE